MQIIAEELCRAKEEIKQANQKDLVNGAKNGLSSALLDRLALTDIRLEAMIDGVRQVITLSDPVGSIRDLKYTPSGLQIGKMRTPIGVIG